MTLFQIIQILKEIALAQPNIKSATDGSIYDIMNTNPSVKYDVVHFSQTTHQSDEETDFYGLNIFYVSRLEDSLEDNRLQIQSIGKEVLDNIIRTFCENWGIDFPVITYTPFTQKFNDLCAGCYCNLRLEIPKEIICADDYVAEVVPGSGIKLQDIGITITQNGLVVVTPDAEYDGIGEVRIEVDVPQYPAVLQDKEVEYTENGSYSIHPDPAYDGLSSVSVDVDVPDRYDEGYDDGKQDGEAEQKAKLTVTSFTENNTYTRENGWSAVTVDVPQTGQTINNQSKRVLINNFRFEADEELGIPPFYQIIRPIIVTADSGYTGLESVEIDAAHMADQAVQYGENKQKAKMVATAITENGEYSRPDGYSAITVDVPQTGQTINNQTKSTTIYKKDVELVDGGWGHYTYRLKDNVPYVFTYDSGYTGLESAEVNLSIDASDAITQGRLIQLEQLSSTSFTQNGDYTRENGWSSITVNVDDRYDEGYADGFAAGASACSALFITAITLNVDSAITDTATATTTYAPLTSITDIYYTSSDPSIAVIDPVTGVITAVSNGSVTICTNDRWSGLQDCKTVAVTKSLLSEPLKMYIVQNGNILWKTTDASFATTIQYKKNNGDWTNITATTGGTSIPVVSGDTVWFRGNNPQYSLGTQAVPGDYIPAPYNTFSGSTAQFELSNNIMSLINSSNFQNLKTFQSAYTFCGLFNGCTGLTNAENLLMPATALTDYCYCGLFDSCSNLVSAPALPATILGTGCYEGMFYRCFSLENIPSTLPATTLKPYCYSHMFYNCSKITVAPVLPAQTLVDYCYLSMFNHCHMLNSIECLATSISATRCTNIWVESVSPTGTFTKASAMSSWTIDENGIPTGWTVANK